MIQFAGFDIALSMPQVAPLLSSASYLALPKMKDSETLRLLIVGGSSKLSLLDMLCQYRAVDSNGEIEPRN